MSNETSDSTTYIDYRWKPEYTRYKQGARLYRSVHVGLTMTILIATLSALVIGVGNPVMQMTAFSVALVAIAINALYDFRDAAHRHQRVADALRHEREMMDAKIGAYKRAAAPKERFVKRCEAILETHGNTYAPIIIEEAPASIDPPTTSTDNPFDKPANRPRRESLSSRFAALSDDDDDDDDSDDDSSQRSSRSPFGSRSSKSSPFGSRSSKGSNPFGSRSSGSSPFSSRSSDDSSSRFSGKRPIGSKGGLRREDNDDPALADMEHSNSRTGVRFAAYYPKELPADTWQPVKAYVMMGYAQDAVAADAENGDVAKLPEILYGRNRNQRFRIPEGAQVTVVPHMPGFQFNPPVRNIGFYRTWHRFDFELRATDARPDEATNGYLTFLVDGLIVADVPLSVYVGRGIKKDKTPPVRGVYRKPYRAIYASFADDDKQLAERFRRIYDALGMYTMRDMMEARAAGEWSNDLLRYVDEVDVFQLVWSDAAAKSEVVTQEVRRAVERRDQTENFIRPVTWQHPTAQLPDELGDVQAAYVPGISN